MIALLKIVVATFLRIECSTTLKSRVLCFGATTRHGLHARSCQFPVPVVGHGVGFAGWDR